MLKGKAKTDYQRLYMRKYRSNKRSNKLDNNTMQSNIKYDADGNQIYND